MVTRIRFAQVIVLGLAASWCAAALAQPPAHAPAHGWRKKHDPSYAGYSGRHWDNDYEVTSGRCNWEAVATVVGGAIGGAIAARVADDHEAVATIVGAAIGALIGNRIGRELDEADRGCVGHALEIGIAGRPVTWTNASTGVRYELAPGADRPRGAVPCREFTLVAVAGSQRSSSGGLACRSRDGVWEIVD